MRFSMKASLALAALAVSAGCAAAAPMVVGRTANLRTGPGLSFPLAGAIAAGQVVDMGACVRGWCQVSWGPNFFGTRTAYAPRAFLVAAAAAPVVASSAPGVTWTAGTGYWDTWGPFGIVAAPFAVAAAPFGYGYAYDYGYAAPPAYGATVVTTGAPVVAAGATVTTTEPVQTTTVRRTRRVVHAPRATSTRIAVRSGKRMHETVGMSTGSTERTTVRRGTRHSMAKSGTTMKSGTTVKRSTTGRGSSSMQGTAAGSTKMQKRRTTGSGASGGASGNMGGSGGGASGGSGSSY